MYQTSNTTIGTTGLGITSDANHTVLDSLAVTALICCLAYYIWTSLFRHIPSFRDTQTNNATNPTQNTEPTSSTTQPTTNNDQTSTRAAFSHANRALVISIVERTAVKWGEAERLTRLRMALEPDLKAQHWMAYCAKVAELLVAVTAELKATNINEEGLLNIMDGSGGGDFEGPA